MKMRILPTTIALVAWLNCQAALAQPLTLWRVDTEDGVLFVEKWGFKKNGKLHIDVDTFHNFEQPGVCRDSKFDLNPDDVRWVAQDFSGLRSKYTFQIHLSDGSDCYTNPNDPWVLKEDGQEERIHTFGDLFSTAIPAVVTIPSTGDSHQTWIPVTWIIRLAPISRMAATDLERKWPPPNRLNSYSPTKTVEAMLPRINAAIAAFRAELEFNWPVTNCGQYISVTDGGASNAKVTVAVPGKDERKTFPIDKIYPRQYPCE